uniref:Uncharacterized protein n=1 Tax=Aegilops tauschii subsp. strangulata TaxID=200361 RepID=A0A453C9Z2_AEGTS
CANGAAFFSPTKSERRRLAPRAGMGAEALNLSSGARAFRGPARTAASTVPAGAHPCYSRFNATAIFSSPRPPPTSPSRARLSASGTRVGGLRGDPEGRAVDEVALQWGNLRLGSFFPLSPSDEI